MAAIQTDAVASVLAAVNTADANVRRSAEAQLAHWESQPGFGLALTGMVLSQGYPAGYRQLAAVVLKKFVKEHWSPEGKHFKPPLARDAEKAAIRSALPAALADPTSMIRTAVSMAVAAIAKWDVPQEWPNLLGDLVRAIGPGQDQNLVHGALRCLSLFVNDLGDEQIMQVAPGLLPELLRIVSSPESHGGPGVARRALSIAHSLITMLATVEGVYSGQVAALLGPQLGAWFKQLNRILALPVTPQDTAGWALQLEVLKLATQLISGYGKAIAPHVPGLLSHAWAMCNACLPLYTEAVVRDGGDEDGEGLLEAAEPDSDGNRLDFETLVAQLLEFLLTLAGSARFQGLLLQQLPDLAYVTVGYMQMTAAQAAAWGADPNQYVADEDDDTFSVRTSGELLLDALAEGFGEPAMAAVAAAVQRRMHDAARAQASGDAQWWKLREAALLAVGSLSEHLCEEAGGSSGRTGNGSGGPLQLPAFLDSVLQQDLAGPTKCPFLQGRALWLAARLAPTLDAARALPFLQAAVRGLPRGAPPAIQVGACRAVAALCPRLKQQLGASGCLPELYEALAQALEASSEETLHLALEALLGVVAGDAAAAAAWEPRVSPLVLRAWFDNIADPLVSNDALEVLQALAAVPEALPSLQARSLPTLCGIVSAPSHHQTTLLERTIDLVVELLRPSGPPQAAAIHAALSPPIMALLMASDDASILQSASLYLRQLVRIGGEELLGWGGGAAGDTLQALLAALARLLSPELGDSASTFAGGVLQMMLRRMPNQVLPAIPALLPSLVAKLAVAQSSPLAVSLLLVVAQLVHLNARHLVDLLQATPAPGGGSGLALVLGVWSERALEMRGLYQMNLSTTALAQLLRCGHPALAGVSVKGRRMDVDSAVRTRSRAKLQAEQWQMVPAPAKMLALLVDALQEARMQAAGGRGGAGDDEDGDSSEWEEVGASDDEHGGYGGTSLADLLHYGGEDSPPGGGGGGILDQLDDPETREDPLYKMDMVAYLSNQLKELAAADQGAFQGYYEQLDKSQKKVLESAFST